jgi:hypothetical protein
MAQEGGIGIVHKNLTARQQARRGGQGQALRVAAWSRDPITIAPRT